MESILGTDCHRCQCRRVVFASRAGDRLLCPKCDLEDVIEVTFGVLELERMKSKADACVRDCRKRCRKFAETCRRSEGQS